MFTHYSYWPLAFSREHVYTPDHPHGFGKPVGFWISVDGEDDWAEWCLRESNLPPWRYRVTLDSGAGILWIQCAEELLAFHETYCVETEFERLYTRAIYGESNKNWPIDWAKVAVDHDGLIIAPYLWSQRMMGPGWYHGWDCASGCIWTTSAIVAVESAPLLALKPSEGFETPIVSP